MDELCQSNITYLANLVHVCADSRDLPNLRSDIVIVSCTLHFRISSTHLMPDFSLELPASATSFFILIILFLLYF